MSELKDEDKMSKTDHKRVPSINSIDIRSLGSSDWRFGFVSLLASVLCDWPQSSEDLPW